MRSVIPWRNRIGGALDPLRHEMRGLFDRFFGELSEGASEALPTWAPRVDVEETDKEIVVQADLPGVAPEDVDISIEDGSLVLRGEKKEERKEEKKDYRMMERFVGRFYREVPLPAGTDPEKIAATSAKGVITVLIPKTPKETKKIAVTRAE